MRIPDALAATAAAQRGLVTRRQLLDAGVSGEAIRWSLGRSARLVLPGVVALFTGSLDPGQRLVAAQLLAGPEAMIASRSAARWHGLVDWPDDGVVRVLVGVGQSARRVGFVVVRRTRRPDPRPWHRGPLTLCSPARALVDTLRECGGGRDAQAAVVAAVQRRLVRLDDLADEVEAGPVRASAGARRAVAVARTGVWSVAEADALTVLATSRILPRVWPNPRLLDAEGRSLPTPDGFIDDVGLAIQVHSRRYHGKDEDWVATVESDTAIGEHGVHVVGVTPQTLTERPDHFRERVERTYLSLARLGRRPAVRMVPRGPGLV
jgi:hypothetical protein